MTPNEIEVLIHCYCCSEPHPRLTARAVANAISNFWSQGLIYSHGDDPANVYRTTPRGTAHIKQLCNLELPTPAWVDSSGKLIEV